MSTASTTASPQGRAANPTKGRVRLVVAALLLQLAIGAVYAWSVFASALQKSADWKLTKVQASVPFEVTIGVIFFGTYVGGRIQDRRGPRTVALVGGVLYSIGVILASFATAPTSSGCSSWATASSAASASASRTSSRSRCCRSGSPTTAA